MTLLACRDEVRVDELDIDVPEFVAEMTDWASDALSELMPGVRVAAKSLHNTIISLDRKIKVDGLTGQIHPHHPYHLLPP
jgi:hypothetical protein